MCLAIPGKVVEAFDQNGLRMAKVQFGGIVREACLEYVPDTKIGEYILVHVGFAISKVNEEEAHRTYRILEEMDQLAELMAPVVGERESSPQTLRTPANDENGFKRPEVKETKVQEAPDEIPG